MQGCTRQFHVEGLPKAETIKVVQWRMGRGTRSFMKTDFSFTRQTVQMMVARATLYTCINSRYLYARHSGD